MIILVDTSVWVDLWRRGNAQLARLLEQDRVVVHPFVLGELALGRLTRRADVLRDLQALQAPRVAAHLLASALLDRRSVWTLDRRLAGAATALGVGL